MSRSAARTLFFSLQVQRPQRLPGRGLPHGRAAFGRELAPQFGQRRVGLAGHARGQAVAARRVEQRGRAAPVGQGAAAARGALAAAQLADKGIGHAKPRRHFAHRVRPGDVRRQHPFAQIVRVSFHATNILKAMYTDHEFALELVPIHARAGYAVQHNEAVFVQDLPRFRVPGFEHGKYRAFEVAGDSMEPTLNHRDIVICSYVDNWRLLVPDEMYVVVTTEAVMLKRIRQRITDLDSEVLLHSDNPHRRPCPLDAADITELWRVRGYLSTYLPTAPDVTVARLWEVIEALSFDQGEVRRHLDENAPNAAPNAR